MMTRQKFIDTIEDDGYVFLEHSEVTERDWFTRTPFAIAVSESITQGLTILNTHTHARLLLDSWDNAYLKLKDFERKENGLAQLHSPRIKRKT